MEYTFHMINKKHIKTIFSKNDTSMTLLSVTTVFILPLFVFSFCYCLNGTSEDYSVKSMEILEKDLSVVSSQSIMSLTMVDFK